MGLVVLLKNMGTLGWPQLWCFLWIQLDFQRMRERRSPRFGLTKILESTMLSLSATSKKCALTFYSCIIILFKKNTAAKYSLMIYPSWQSSKISFNISILPIKNCRIVPQLKGKELLLIPIITKPTKFKEMPTLSTKVIMLQTSITAKPSLLIAIISSQCFKKALIPLITLFQSVNSQPLFLNNILSYRKSCQQWILNRSCRVYFSRDKKRSSNLTYSKTVAIKLKKIRLTFHILIV